MTYSILSLKDVEVFNSIFLFYKIILKKITEYFVKWCLQKFF